jgi:hypothetical protein
MVASREYVENILDTFARATEANRLMPGRHGSTIELTSDLCDEVMVTGDVHGHKRNANLIRRLAALDEHPRRHLVVQEVCHGGPVYPQNGGCMSHAILEDIAWLKSRFPRQVHFILGNHELSEMTDYPIQKNRQMLNLSFRLGLQQMYGPAAEDVRQAILCFLWSCPLAVRLPQGVFISHSLPDGVDFRGFDPSVLVRDLVAEDFVEQSDVFRMLWGRDYRRENAKAFCEKIGAKILITGHEPCAQGFLAPNEYQIILDCCGDQATYVVLPIDEELSHAEIVKRLKRLEDG